MTKKLVLLQILKEEMCWVEDEDELEQCLEMISENEGYEQIYEQEVDINESYGEFDDDYEVLTLGDDDGITFGEIKKLLKSQKDLNDSQLKLELSEE